MIRLVLLTTALAVAGSSTASGAEPPGAPLRVPNGDPVTVDGSFGDAEWSEAARRSLAGGIELLARKDADALYLAFRFTETKHSGLDLYLADPRGARRLFHVSSELGTKTWTDSAWSEYDWGSVGWSGNAVDFEKTEDDLIIYEPDGFELRLDHSMLDDRGLGSDTLRLSFRLKRPELTVPPGADEAPLERWLVLRVPTPAD